MRYLLGFVVSLALSYILTWVVRLLAPKVGLLDLPRRDRWHRRPVPRAGGAAIYIAFTVPMLLLRERPLAGTPLVLLIGGAAIFLVGLVDDLIRLENRPKLVLLILCAVIPGLLGARFELLPPLLGVPLAILWILGVTNAFNWLDNMDGVAGGIAAIASAGLFVLSMSGDAGEVAELAALLGGAAAGFLLHNFPPARVFMGDSGSGFLGFTLAALAVMGSHRSVSNVLLTVLVPALILAIPIFDTAMVALMRVLNRRSIFRGGRDHPAHRLVAMGLPERKAVLLLYGLGALAGITALVVSSMDFLAGMSLSAVLVLAFVALGSVLAEIRTYEEPLRSAQSEHSASLGTRSLPRGGLTLLPGPFMNKKWIFLTLLDIVLVIGAYISAHLLRYEGQMPVQVASEVARTLPLVLAAKMATLYLSGAYRGAWRYVGLLDAVRLVEGVTAGSLLAFMGLSLWARLDGFWFSRAALILDWILTLVLVVGSRLLLRLVREYLVSQAANGPRILIFGAGEEGVLLLRAVRETNGPGYRPVGFVDEDPSKRGMVIQGLSVLGTHHDLRELIRKYRVDEVFVTQNPCPPEVLAEVADVCRDASVPMKKLGWVLE